VSETGSSPARRGRGAGAMVAVVVVLLALVSWVGVAWLLRERAIRAAFPQVSGQLRVSGLASRLEIQRDSRGVPHVEAGSESDAWFGLGFVHAQDRAAQMLWLRRLARGRTAELLGESGLPADRLARTLGIGRLADAQVERLNSEAREALDAYSRGVDAHLDRLRSGRVAPPVRLLEPPAAVEAWTPGDSLALVKLLHWQMGNSHETALVLEDLTQRLGAVAARPFYPRPRGFLGSTISLATELRMVDPNGGAGTASAAGSAARELARGPARQLRFSLGGGAWVLAGRYTTSGAPILVANIEVAPTAPSLLYEAHVRGADLNVAGVTVPGIPVFWAGRSQELAWAATPGRAATVDVYREAVRSGEPPLYQHGSRWVPLVVSSQAIRVRMPTGALREEQFTVRATRHGPLINPLLQRDREDLALAWTGQIPGDGVTGMLEVARARSAEELREALRNHHEPVLELVYADRAGRGGMQVAGWIPRRALSTSLVPVPGRLRTFDWRQAIEFDALPAERISSEVGPAGSARGFGWIVAAGGSLDDVLSGAQIEWSWRDENRARRFERMLEELTRKGPVDLHAAAEAQLDVAGDRAPEVVDAIGTLLERNPELTREAAEILDLLRSWDGATRADSAGAAAYQVLLQHALRGLFIEPVGEELLQRYLGLPGTRPEAMVESIVLEASRLQSSGGWTDSARVSQAMRVACHRTWLTLLNRLGPNRQRWEWGRLHRLWFRPFGATSSNLLPGRADIGPFERGGDGASVDHSGFASSHPFDVTSSSLYRLAVDLAAPDRVLSTLAPGQSEHPGHPHFDHGVARWREGRASLFATSRFLLEEESLLRLVLEPGP
jgi:penicillin amidase